MNNNYYIDQADEGYYLIKDNNDNRFTAGYNKQDCIELISRLNNTHRPNIEQYNQHELYICWNNHDKHEKCSFELIIFEK
jgi:hypothetical protein